MAAAAAAAAAEEVVDPLDPLELGWGETDVVVIEAEADTPDPVAVTDADAL